MQYCIVGIQTQTLSLAIHGGAQCAVKQVRSFWATLAVIIMVYIFMFIII